MLSEHWHQIIIHTHTHTHLSLTHSLTYSLSHTLTHHTYDIGYRDKDVLHVDSVAFGKGNGGRHGVVKD